MHRENDVSQSIKAVSTKVSNKLLLNPEININQLLQDARDYLELNDYKKADSCYKQALEIEPDNLRALTGRGMVFESEKNFERAKRYYQKAINKNTHTTDKNGLDIVKKKLTALEKLLLLGVTKATAHETTVHEVAQTSEKTVKMSSLTEQLDNSANTSSEQINNSGLEPANEKRKILSRDPSTISTNDTRNHNLQSTKSLKNENLTNTENEKGLAGKSSV